MGLGGALLLAGVVILLANVVTTRRLWASPIFETSQKIAQTVLVWLVPGGAILVWSVLREPRIDNQGDPNTAGAAFIVTDGLFGSHGEPGHHGNDGSHHGSDGGHHMGGDWSGGHGGHGGYGGDGGHGGGFDGGGGGHL